MKKTSKLFKLAMMFTVVCMAILTLEVFDLHPHPSIGNFHSYWVGIRKMNLQSSGTMIIPLTSGAKEIYKEYNFGIFKVVSTEDVP